MTDALLVLNGGSSSLKFSVFQTGDLGLLVRGQVEGIGTGPRLILRSGSGELIEEQTLTDRVRFDHTDALGLILQRLQVRVLDHRLVGVGHRVVHGGVKHAAPARIDACLVSELEQLVPLAPLHQPHNLAAIKAVFLKTPHLPQVACFDTAFHRTQSQVAQWFGLPRRYTEQGVRRYGFHGLSYEFVAAELPSVDPRAAAGKTIVAHLGNGASMCALQAGRSIATTMSFTPADGLVMGTRVGSLDPGVLLYLMTRHGLDAAGLEKLVYHESGLLGVSGISSDMRTLLASADPQAAEAIDLFVYRLGRELGSLVAALGGLDALVFTGGIGENSDLIRARVCQDAAWIGIRLNDDANRQGSRRISYDDSKVAIYVIATNEECIMAQHTQRVLGFNGAI
ncbi:MAG: acetate/propionate family kinase [Planctomycetes bacterium]|nr:acetate/propionate family kinase [Planctomycetota bacterium]